jgi:uridine kinase
MTCFAICGDSGTGKTTMATALAGCLSDVTILECDRYHKWERNDYHWRKCTHLDPAANYIDLMNSDVKILRSGINVFRRDYDHQIGKFTQPIEIPSADNIIVCGLHTFMCPENLYDIKIFMDTDIVLKTQWKIARDTCKRGYELEQIKQQIRNRQRDYELFIAPLMKDADIIVNFYSNADNYIDYIKGIGRSLKIFVRKTYVVNTVLEKFNNLSVSYTLSNNSDRDGFCEICIDNFETGYYYDYIALCVLEIIKSNGI